MAKVGLYTKGLFQTPDGNTVLDKSDNGWYIYKGEVKDFAQLSDVGVFLIDFIE